MKKNAISLVVLYVCQSMLMVVYASPESLDPLIGGQVVYRSSTLSELDDLEVAGVKLSTYNYVDVYRYVFLNSETLVVLGRTNRGKFSLSSISLNNHTFTQLREYPPELFSHIAHAELTVFSMQKLPSLSPFIIIEHPHKESHNHAETIMSYFEVLSPDGSGKYRVQKQAILPTMSVFLSDANSDGYTDILIWERSLSSSQSVNNKEHDDVAEGEMQVMVFKPDEKTFFPLTPLRQMFYEKDMD